LYEFCGSRRFWVAEFSVTRRFVDRLDALDASVLWINRYSHGSSWLYEFCGSRRFWVAECSVMVPCEREACASGTAIAATSNASVMGVRTFMVCISLLDDRGFRSIGFDGARGRLRPDSGTVAAR
jgi:hypothetical protein